MSTKHAPGPWTQEPRRGVYFIDVVDDNGDLVATANPRNTDAKQEANARLIAAAPALLDAVRSFVAAHDQDSFDLCRDASIAVSPCDCDLCLSAHAAIAKAEGREP